jgi:hypothetical protein
LNQKQPDTINNQPNQHQPDIIDNQPNQQGPILWIDRYHDYIPCSNSLKY